MDERKVRLYLKQQGYDRFLDDRPALGFNRDGTISLWRYPIPQPTEKDLPTDQEVEEEELLVMRDEPWFKAIVYLMKQNQANSDLSTNRGKQIALIKAIKDS